MIFSGSRSDVSIAAINFIFFIYKNDMEEKPDPMAILTICLFSKTADLPRPTTSHRLDFIFVVVRVCPPIILLINYVEQR